MLEKGVGFVCSLAQHDRKHGISPGRRTYDHVVKSLQESIQGLGWDAIGLLPIDKHWLMEGTAAVVEISVKTFVEHARIEVHITENDTFYTYSHISAGAIHGIAAVRRGRFFEMFRNSSIRMTAPRGSW